MVAVVAAVVVAVVAAVVVAVVAAVVAADAIVAEFAFAAAVAVAAVADGFAGPQTRARPVFAGSTAASFAFADCGCEDKNCTRESLRGPESRVDCGQYSCHCMRCKRFDHKFDSDDDGELQ